MERINTNPHIIEFVLKRNKYFPNSRLPIVIYQSAVILPKQKKKAAEIVQKIVARNGWGNSWSNGIYDFHHYHSITHECMIVCSGSAKVILGGPNGRRIILKSGDVIFLPAGVGHRCTSFTKDFLCVGTYPQGKDYDTNTGTSAELKKSVANIKKVPLPKKDPLFGKQGFLKTFWKK